MSDVSGTLGKNRQPSGCDVSAFGEMELRVYWWYCTGVTGLTRLSEAYPRNPVTGELALNGSTDKARFTACVAHVNTIQATQRAMPS